MSNAETSLLGAVLIDPTVYGRVQVLPAHFSSEASRVLWAAMGELHEAQQPIDIVSLAATMGEAKLAACGGFAYMSSLAVAAGTASNAEFYANLVRDQYLKKSIGREAAALVEPWDGETGEDMLSRFTGAAEALTGSLSRAERTLGSVVGEEVSRSLRSTGEPLGLPLDCMGISRWIPGGLPTKKVVMVFADTGSYKTTWTNQLIFDWASRGHQGMIVPLEDSDELTAHRWISRKTGIGYGKIAGGICNDAERQLIEKLTPADWACLNNIKSVDGIEPKIDSIIRAVASAKAKSGGKLKWVMVDYMQLMEGRGSPQEVITDAMRKSANAAKRYDVAWGWVSQKNDRSDERKDPRPNLKDLFGSGSMKQMAKTVFALFRPSEEWPNPTGESHPLWGMYAKLIDRHPQGREIYNNVVELWVLKNLLGRKKSMRTLLAKPDVGILDPVDLKAWM